MGRTGWFPDRRAKGSLSPPPTSPPTSQPRTLGTESQECYPGQGGARTTGGTGAQSLSPSPLRMSFPFHRETRGAVCCSQGVPRHRHLCARTGKGDTPTPTSGSRPGQTEEMKSLSPSLPHTPGSTTLPPSMGLGAQQPSQAQGQGCLQPLPLPASGSQAAPLPHTPAWLLLPTLAYPAAHFRQDSPHTSVIFIPP